MLGTVPRHTICYIYDAGCRARMADIKQGQQIHSSRVKFPLCQDVCELFFGVNVFDLDFGVQINSIE